MKRKITIEIETEPKGLGVLPREGSSEEDYTPEELIKFRKEFDKDLIEYTAHRIKNYLENNFEEEFMDELEDCYIEGYDEFEKYNVEVKFEEEIIDG